jgi:hypothetical protein
MASYLGEASGVFVRNLSVAIDIETCDHLLLDQTKTD